MNRKIIELFIKWIWTVTSLLTYQSNIIPHEQLVELTNAATKLVNALVEESE